MKPIRIAIVGLGARGTLSWIPQLRAIDGFRITAICDRIESLHSKGLEALGDAAEVKVYSRYEDVLADKDIDAIGLTVRCKEQGAMAALALEAGKHVNCEVPAAHTMEDCWRIVVAQERSGCVYHLAEQVRFAGYVQGWRRLVADGGLGKVTYAEGQYHHYYVVQCFQNPRTGEFYPPADIASHPEAVKTWLHEMPPIHYLPHDLNPLLEVLNDRVVEVIGMSTACQSSAHPELDWPDMQAALMKTEKGALLRMTASFAQPHPAGEGSYHWQQIIGTRGCVELGRAKNDPPKLWLADSENQGKIAADWSWEPEGSTPEACASGHGGLDYYVHTVFRDAILGIKPLEFDVYRAMNVTAPSILAAESIAQDSRKLLVPDFRPNAKRAAGEMPRD